jgi:hypothetical protein
VILRINITHLCRCFVVVITPFLRPTPLDVLVVVSSSPRHPIRSSDAPRVTTLTFVFRLVK